MSRCRPGRQSCRMWSARTVMGEHDAAAPGSALHISHACSAFWMHPCFPWATVGLSTLVSLGCDDASTAFPAFSYGVDSAGGGASGAV